MCVCVLLVKLLKVLLKKGKEKTSLNEFGFISHSRVQGIDKRGHTRSLPQYVETINIRYTRQAAHVVLLDVV